MTFSERWCRCGRHHRRQEPNAITINTNDVSGRSTPSAVSYDGKLRHVGVNAEGRLMSAPKQTLSQLVLALSGNTMAKRAEKYQWLFPFQEDSWESPGRVKNAWDGRLGPVTFDGDDFAVHPAMPLASLLRTLSSYAGTTKPKQLCVAVPDFFTDAELATVSDAVKLCELAAGEAHLLRHSSAVAMAFGHSQGSKLFPEVPQEDGETFSECLYRCSEEELGVQSMVRCLLSEAISRIEQKHKCKVLLKTKSGIRLSNEEAFLPEGPEGPEIDVSVPLTRHIFETAAAEVLKRLKEALVEALAFQPEAFELLGGGSRIPAVQARVKEVAGELPLRFGLDGASCVATGAAAWAAGRRWVDALDVPMEGLAPDVLESIREQEAKMEAIHSEEVKRLEKRNALESYVYQVRDWMTLGLSKTRAEDFEDQEKEIENAAAAERERRKEHGMDFDKDERVMKKEDRMRLAQKNKDEGNDPCWMKQDMFKAQKFDDAVRRYKKAIEHVSRPEVQSNLTPEEAEEAKKIKVSCHLNSAQCYIKAGEAATQSGGKNAAELFYKKARTSCDDELDASSIKAIFRRSLCYEKLGELEDALKDRPKTRGEPLTEEDPVPSPSRRCEAGPPMPPMPVKMKEVTSSPRSRISQLEAANVRAAAQQTADSLLLQFQRQGFADPHNAASQCLQSALELLSPHRKPTKDPFGALKDDFPQRGVQALVAPEEFKNPSTFLRVYGDPAVKSGHQRPESMQDRRSFLARRTPVPTPKGESIRVRKGGSSATQCCAGQMTRCGTGGDLQRGRHVAWCSAPLVLSVALSAWSLSAFSFTGETAPCRSLSPRLTSLAAGRSERPAELFGSLDLLSPKGVPSEEGGAPVPVWALLPGRGGAEAVPLGRWALQPPSIGRSNEWDTWDYLQALLGERWWGAYAWEYWRFLCMLKTHGFLVLDNFLPASLAEQLCSVASRALQQKQFGQGKLSTGASFARGDAVLWVNTRDPAAEALENMRPEELRWQAEERTQEGQSSASIPELKEVLEQIDTLVAEILAPEFPERMGCIRTRSHAMFTCYPGAREAAELVDAQGESWAGPCASSSARGYLRHLDNERAKGHCGRILTTILYLNPDWQPSDGGGIRLFEVKPPLQVRAELLPHANRLLCFWADEIPHEVLPPKRDRFACTFWYLDRDADPSSVPFEKAPNALAAKAAGAAFLD
eukprot:g27839.t1